MEHGGVHTGYAIIDWLAGDGLYTRLVDCMGHDWPWIAMTVFVKCVIILGYVEFARRNYKEFERTTKHSEPAKAYMALVWVFLFCAMCGYAFPIIRLIYPCYRLEVIFNLVLAYFTWALVGSARTTDFIRRIFGARDDI